MTLNMTSHAKGLEQPTGTTTTAACYVGDAVLNALPKGMPLETSLSILLWAAAKKCAEIAAREATRPPPHRERIRATTQPHHRGYP